MFKIKTSGNFNNLKKTLKKSSDLDLQKVLEYYGNLGVEKLKAATPRDTGKTAESWSYIITKDNNKARIQWVNSNVTNEGTPIVILLQYGHGTISGAYVEGTDFINPAIQDVIDDAIYKAWKEVI